MIELDIYFYWWLGNLLQPIENMNERWPLAASLSTLIGVRIPLASFAENPERGRAFPNTARIAGELVSAINEIVPPVSDDPPPTVVPRIHAAQIDRIKALSHGLAAALRDEAQHSYVLKVEDQRCFSSYTLVEKIEACFSPDSWSVINDSAKREFEESGKCLALERYTGAGFHSLRGVECVIRQYIEKLTGSPPTKKRDWGFYIQVLKDNGAAADLTSVLDNIRMQERNPLMHPEDWLQVDDAIATFNICHTAIFRLVAGIKNVPITAASA
jgi:hypothetical protein